MKDIPRYNLSMLYEPTAAWHPAGGVFYYVYDFLSELVCTEMFTDCSQASLVLLCQCHNPKRHGCGFAFSHKA